MTSFAATRQRQLHIAAGANAVFILSLFLPWFSLGSYDSISGWNALPAPLLIALAALVALAALLAEANRFALPRHLAPLGIAAYASTIPLWFSFTGLVSGGTGRAWGLFVAVLASLVATVFSARIWREPRR